jgi:hypothetical protein
MQFTVEDSTGSVFDDMVSRGSKRPRSGSNALQKAEQQAKDGATSLKNKEKEMKLMEWKLKKMEANLLKMRTRRDDIGSK